MTIALLCPTRGRPEQFKRMVRSAYSTIIDTVHPWTCSNGSNDGYALEQMPIDCPTVFMWNHLAQRALEYDKDCKLFMLASDDIIFDTPGWDKALIDHYNSLENKIHVYSLRDSRDKDGTPHPIVTREYIEAMGYFLPPLFMHWFVDTWTVEIAKANNCFTHLTDYLLIHDKPNDHGKPDETHSRIRRMGWHSRDVYVNETCQHFLAHEKMRLASHINNKLGYLMPNNAPLEMRCGMYQQVTE